MLVAVTYKVCFGAAALQEALNSICCGKVDKDFPRVFFTFFQLVLLLKIHYQ